MKIKISKEILVLSLVVGLGLIFLSLYMYYTSLTFGDQLLSSFIKCALNEYKEFSQLELIQSWFEAGLKFEIKNCNYDIISYNFPYIFWLGWIITLVSLYLNFRTIEKIK